ncbi:MAG: hypothetical protein ACR2LQ_13215 [Acidimicrobiales bacterium]
MLVCWSVVATAGQALAAPVSAAQSIPQPPDATAPGPAPAPGKPPPAGVEEVGARTEFSKTFDNPDGTKSLQIAVEPLHFKGANSAWQDIVSAVAADSAAPGSFVSGANSWTAHFGPLPGGVVIDTAAGPVSFSPVGAAAVRPQRLPDGTGVVYPDAWPGADLRYRVRAGGVKEEIVLKQRPSTNKFDFTTSGITFDATAGGGLAPKTIKLLGWLISVPATKPLGSIAPPEVQDARGTPLALAAPVLTATTKTGGSTLRVAFDQTAVAALPDSAYPVVVDPTWNSNNMYSWKSDGVNCACGVRVGNTLEPGGINKYWRSTGLFDYSNILGAHVYSARIDLSSLTAGTANGYQIDADWASANSYTGAPGYGTYATTSGDDTTSAILTGTTSTSLTALYDYWVHSNIPGGVIGFVGQETPGLYTFKQFSSYILTLTYGSTVAPPPTGVTSTDVRPITGNSPDVITEILHP